MPNSLRCKIKHLCHNGTITESERDRIIKALDQASCEDLEAIKYLIKPTITSTSIGEEKQKELNAYNMAIEALKEQRWIPINEKLPSDCGYDWVLVQIQEDNGYLWIPCVAEYRKGRDDWFSDTNQLGWLKDHNGAFKVTAWMPLPAPYKLESEDET